MTPKTVVVSLVMLMAEDGTFDARLVVPEGGDARYPMPSRDTLDAITRMLAFEWAADTLKKGTE